MAAPVNYLLHDLERRLLTKIAELEARIKKLEQK